MMFRRGHFKHFWTAFESKYSLPFILAFQSSHLQKQFWATPQRPSFRSVCSLVAFIQESLGHENKEHELLQRSCSPVAARAAHSQMDPGPSLLFKAHHILSDCCTLAPPPQMSLTPPAGLDSFQTGTWCKHRPPFDLQHRAASRWDTWSQLTVVQKTPNELWMRGECDPVGPRVSLCVWESDYTPQLATLEAKSFSFALSSSQMSSRPLRLSQEELTHSTYVWGAWGRHC